MSWTPSVVRPWRTASVVVATCLVLGAVAVLSGCESKFSPHQQAASSRAHVADIEAEADAIYVDIWGDASEKEAAHYLEFKKLNASLVSCVKHAGFVDYVPPFRRMWSGWLPDGTETSGWLGKLDWKPSVHAVHRSAGSHAHQLDSSLSSSEKAAVQTCAATTQPSQDAGTYPLQSRVASEYEEMLGAVDQELGDISEYQTCMAQQGFDLGDESGATGISVYLTYRMPRPPQAGESPDPQWEAYVSLETRALAADRECRQSKYERALEILEPELATFRADHAAELQTLRERAQHVLRRATLAGFDDSAS